MGFIAILLGNMLHKWGKLRELLVERYLNHYYSQKMGKMGKGVRILKRSRITGLDKIVIEDNVTIADNVFIRGEGGLYIGPNCHFSRNVVIYTHNHNYEGAALPYDNTFRYRKVTIEKNVWVGINVTILPGAHIKEGSIIGAGSVVAGVVEPLSIMGAPLVKPLKYRDKEHYERLDREKKYGGPNGVPLES
ncbi:MAG: acyltransferase [Calditrichae bacterium]|nr:acyltransferase [Calditrichota bacterium]MCB9090868.1 acyltransferase [Calditrichia bacterium]